MLACHDLTDGQAARLPCHAPLYEGFFETREKASGARPRVCYLYPIVRGMRRRCLRI